jgi:hypothetical protein
MRDQKSSNREAELTAIPRIASGAVLGSWVECTDDYEKQQGGERWIRRIDAKCWISVLHRMTGFGWMEWETAIVFIIEDGSRPKRWKSDDRDCLIIGGDRREELATMPKEQLRQWYEDNINGNRNSMGTLLHALRA